MKIFKLLTLSGIVLTSILGSAQARRGIDNCQVSYSPEGGAIVQIDLESTESILNINSIKSVFEQSTEMIEEYSEPSVWSFTSPDKSFKVYKHDTSGVTLLVKNHSFLSVNYNGDRTCSFVGQGARVLLKALLSSSSSFVEKSHENGIDRASLYDVIRCRSSLHGSPQEEPSCFFL